MNRRDFVFGSILSGVLGAQALSGPGAAWGWLDDASWSDHEDVFEHRVEYQGWLWVRKKPNRRKGVVVMAAIFADEDPRLLPLEVRSIYEEELDRALESEMKRMKYGSSV